MDGRDGAVLLNLTSNRYDVSSDLTIQTEAGNEDVFLFRVQGRNGKDPFPAGAIHGATGVQRVVSWVRGLRGPLVFLKCNFIDSVNSGKE